MEQEPEEGVIKFRCRHAFAASLPDNFLTDLKHFRQLLYMQKFIGEDENCIGYGNISQRFGNTNRFIITGTQTGHLPNLESEHFTLVENYNISENWLKCVGPVKASSESLTHAALYSASSGINAVIHIHAAAIWNKYIHKLPTTPENIPYGSPEMAYAIQNLLCLYKAQNGVVIMGGHVGGIIAYGEDIKTAYNLIKELI